MGKSSKKDKLTMKEELLVKAITNVGAPTFGNGTKSAQLAYNPKNENVASSMAVTTLRKERVGNAISEAMERHGLNDDVQIGSIKRILAGAREYDTVVEHFGKDNKRTGRTVTTVKVSNKDILQANALLYKVTGRFDANRALGKAMSDKLRAIAREFRPLKPDDSSKKHLERQRSQGMDTGSSTGRGGGGPTRVRGGEDTPSHNPTQIPKGGVEVPSEVPEAPLKPVKSKPSAPKRGVKTRKTTNSRKKVSKGSVLVDPDPEELIDKNNVAIREAELLREIADLKVKLKAKLKDVKPDV